MIYERVDMGNFEDTTERHVSVESGHPAILDLPPVESVPSPSVSWYVCIWCMNRKHNFMF